MVAVVQVRSCGRCGAPVAAGAPCFGCGLAGGSATATIDPLVDAVPAPAARWLLALVVDLVVAAAPAAVGWLALATAPATLRMLATVLGAVLGLGVVGGLLLGRGRTLGGTLCSERLLDGLTGEPVRAGRLVGRLVAGSGWGLRAVDLRRGPDPFRQLVNRPTTDRAPLDPDRTVAPAPAPGAVPVPLPPAVAMPRRVRPTDNPASTSGPSIPPRQTAPAPRSVPSAYAGPVAPGTEPAAVEIALSNGERYQVRDALLLGRSPEELHAPGGRRPALLTWPDLSRRLATTHLLLERDGGALWVTDLDSPTGTVIVTPEGQEAALIPRLRTAAPAGTVLRCGGRTVTVLGAAS